jgi:PKD repeat protein
MFRTLRFPIAVAILMASLVVGAGVASAAAWQAPIPLNISATSAASLPAVGIDGVGNTVATWQTDPAVGPNVIQGTRHQFGGVGFQQLPDVATDATLANTDAIVVVNRAGQGFVAWVHTTGSPMNAQQVQILTISPGGLLGSSALPVSTDGGQYSHLSGAINAAGDAVIAWTHTGTNEAVTRQGLAGAFTPQQTLDSAAAGGPSVAIDSGGNALAVWPTSSLPAGSLEYARHPAVGAWGGGGTIHTPSHTYTDQALSGNPNGQVVVAFQDSGSAIDAVHGTTSAGFDPTIQPLSTPIVNPHGPGVNVDDSGNAVVGWASNSGAQYSQRPNGTSTAFSPPAGALSITPAPMPNNFELRGNGRGDVIAAWYSNELPSAHNVVRAAVKPAGSNSFGGSQIISDQTRDTYDELIAVDENGDAVVGMPLGSSGGPLGVEAAVYDASPPVIGALSGPTRIARGARGSFSTTATDAFSGVSLSWSFGDGSAAASGASASHTFTRTGSFTVRVTATDTAGNSAARQITVTVSAPRLPSCRVPKLKGKSLSQAQTLLRRAHCKLGKVHKPRPRRHHKLRKLIVASSSPGAGRVRANGTRVSLTLKEAPKPKHKHKH